ncbi:unnamed protein product [Prorocentrum cordatum]|uniref:Tudor domain-containing protein n=1 Tax=Prorocentrum cordatum TaxID=2364126 RepID=A0ABN9Q3D1_9DINO|nr:unnamed protein product [Polarella glacialis]
MASQIDYVAPEICAPVDPMDEAELQAQHDEACDEVAELAGELRAVQLEAQQLRQRLQAAARSHGGVPAPTALPAAGSAPAAEEERQASDLRRLIEWLARHADLARPELLDVGFEVPIGGRTVHLQRVVQWPLTTAPSGGRLRLTAPAELQDRLGSLLAAARTEGHAQASELKAMAAAWDLVSGELAPAGRAVPEPSVLLAERGSDRGILVATWPTSEALLALPAKSSTAIPRLGPSRGPCTPDAPLPLAAASPPQHGGEWGAPLPGDRVEVEYEGRWYAGVLHAVGGEGKASVRCDVDAPGVLTVAPIYRVRQLGADAAAAASAAGAAAAGRAAAAGLASSAAAAVGHRPAAAAPVGLPCGRDRRAAEATAEPVGGQATAATAAAGAAGGAAAAAPADGRVGCSVGAGSGGHEGRRTPGLRRTRSSAL